MEAVRRGAWVLLKYVTALYFVGVVAQFFLVGYGLFDMKHGATIDKAKSLDPHRAVGWLLVVVAIVMVILVLLAWPAAKLIGRWVVLAVLTILQAILAAAGVNHWVVGMFHPVIAVILLGLSGWLAHYAFKADRSADSAPAAMVEAG
jgi:hypothetical protein